MRRLTERSACGSRALRSGEASNICEGLIADEAPLEEPEYSLTLKHLKHLERCGSADTTKQQLMKSNELVRLSSDMLSSSSVSQKHPNIVKF